MGLGLGGLGGLEGFFKAPGLDFGFGQTGWDWLVASCQPSSLDDFLSGNKNIPFKKGLA